MKGGVGQLMKQAQEMQANMKRAQEEMASISVTGESGAGMVRIIMTCQHQVQAVEIDDSMIGDDKEMLEDLIIAGINKALDEAAAMAREEMQKTAGNFLPPGFDPSQLGL